MLDLVFGFSCYKLSQNFLLGNILLILSSEELRSEVCFNFDCNWCFLLEVYDFLFESSVYLAFSVISYKESNLKSDIRVYDSVVDM